MGPGQEGRRGLVAVAADSPTTISPAIATPATGSSRRNSLNSMTEEEESPTALESINPMIFVPLEDTLFKPLATPRSKIERLELAAQRTERYSKSMEDNVWHSFRRERDRVYYKLRKAIPPNEKLPPPLGILPQEVDVMVHSLSAPEVPGTDFSQHREPPSGRSPEGWTQQVNDHAVAELSSMVLSGALPSFAFVEEHRQRTAGGYRQAIEREKAAEARSGTAGGSGST